MPDSPAPPVEVAPDSPELVAVSVAEEDSLPVEEDSVADDDSDADDDSLPVEDASELAAVDEASVPEEAPVSWLAAVVSVPVMPPRALLTAPPAAEVIPPMTLGDVRILAVRGRGGLIYSTRFSGCWRPGVAIARPLRRATVKYWNCIMSEWSWEGFFLVVKNEEQL